MSVLLNYYRALEVFRSRDDLIPVQRVATFLLVAMRGKVTREDVADALGQSSTSAYRNLMALSEGPYRLNAARKEGMGLLQVREDEYETRRLVWTLSAKGQRLKTQIEELLTNDTKRTA